MDGYWLNYWLALILTCFVSYIYNCSKSHVLSGKLWYCLTWLGVIFEVIDIATDFNYLLWEFHLSPLITFLCTISVLAFPIFALWLSLSEKDNCCDVLKEFFAVYLGIPEGMDDKENKNKTVIGTKFLITLTENGFVPFFVLYDAFNVGDELSWLTCLTIATSVFGVFNNLSFLASYFRKNEKDCFCPIFLIIV